MKEIKGLIKKDLFNLVSYKNSILIIIVFICAFAYFSSNAINYIPIMIVTMIGMIAIATFSYDEQSKSDKYILSMPVNKKEIVVEKYILTILATIIGAILGYIITIIIININNNIRPENFISLDYSKLFITTISGMFGISLVEAIQIPSIYKWGAEKGRIEMFVLIFAIALIIGALGYFLTEAKVDINVEIIKNFFKQYGIITLVIIMTIMYYISYKISYNIYNKKDI